MSAITGVLDVTNSVDLKTEIRSKPRIRFGLSYHCSQYSYRIKQLRLVIVDTCPVAVMEKNVWCRPYPVAKRLLRGFPEVSIGAVSV